MKLISLWQPWATAMALGWKWNETRSWSTKYRGPVAIHAAKQSGTSLLDIRRLCCQKLDAGGRNPMGLPDFPRGAIVAFGDLMDVLPVEDFMKLHPLADLERAWGDYSPKRFIWLFSSIHPIAPLPYKGTQGLRDIPEEVVSQVSYLKVS